MPKVSVITTFRNAAPFLGRALASIASQSFGDFEHILVNDGSRDDWRAVLAAHADPRQRLRSCDDGVGRVRALNMALEMATGEYVAILDADDATAPRRLARQVACLDGDPRVLLAGAHCRYVAEGGRELGFFTPPAAAGELRQAMTHGNPLAHSAVMYRREAVGGGYRPDYPYAHDFELYLRLLGKGELINIAELLVDVTIHAGQMRAAPELAVARLHDEARCYALAGRLPGLSREARAKGRRARMYVAIRHAQALLAAGRPREGLAAYLKSFLSSPPFFVRAFWVNKDLRNNLRGAGTS